MIHNDRWQYIKACWDCGTTPRQDVLDKMKKQEDKWSDLFMEEVYSKKEK